MHTQIWGSNTLKTTESEPVRHENIKTSAVDEEKQARERPTLPPSSSPSELSIQILNIGKQLTLTMTQLAALIGVTERTLSDWKNRKEKELPPKALRLQRLIEVVNYLLSQNHGLKSKDLLSILHNGRIILDPSDEEDGSISLIGYINAYPEENGWVANTTQAKQYFDQLLIRLKDAEL